LRGTFGGLTHGQGITPLHLAAEKGNAATAAVLMRAGADRSIKEELYQGDPAGWATYFGHDELAEAIRNFR
jgi:ankyrin repeat protein